MRAASYNFESYNSFFDIDFEEVDIHDSGNLEVADTIDDTLSKISIDADKYVRDGKIR